MEKEIIKINQQDFEAIRYVLRDVIDNPFKEDFYDLIEKYQPSLHDQIRDLFNASFTALNIIEKYIQNGNK